MIQNVDSGDKTAHSVQPDLDLHCLQKLVSSSVRKALT